MKVEYVCYKCRKKYPLDKIRYTGTPKGFKLVCQKCCPENWNLKHKIRGI